MAKTHYTKILDRFMGYSVADCDCKLCLHYGGKKRGCALSECCCAEERREAAQQERLYEAAVLCRG